MAAVALAARYGRTVEVDVCDGCGGLWFDDSESQQLTPGATMALLDRVTLRPSRAVQSRMPCPRCRQTLYDVHDQHGTHIMAVTSTMMLGTRESQPA